MAFQKAEKEENLSLGEKKEKKTFQKERPPLGSANLGASASLLAQLDCNTLCFFVLFLPQGTSSFIFWCWVLFWEGHFKGDSQVMESKRYPFKPLSPLLHPCRGLEHCPRSSGNWTWHWDSFGYFCLVGWLVSWGFVYCLFLVVPFSLQWPPSLHCFSQTVYYTVLMFLCVHNIAHCRMQAVLDLPAK